MRATDTQRLGEAQKMVRESARAENENSAAFPDQSRVHIELDQEKEADEIEMTFGGDPGLTKLEWATVMIAQGMAANGRYSSPPTKEAARIARACLEAAGEERE